MEDDDDVVPEVINVSDDDDDNVADQHWNYEFKNNYNLCNVIFAAFKTSLCSFCVVIFTEIIIISFVLA